MRFPKRRCAESADMVRVLAPIRALNFRLAATFHRDFSHRDASDGRPDQSTRSHCKGASVFADVAGGGGAARGGGAGPDAKRTHRSPPQINKTHHPRHIPTKPTKFFASR